MSYQVANNTAVSVRHAVRDLAGVLLTGQAGAITTALTDAAAASSAISVTIAEIGSTGWYLLTFTPNTTGVWNLEVTNPAVPTSDGQVADYAVQSVEPGLALSSRLLTTVDRVKRRMDPGFGSTWDTEIGEIVSEVSADLQHRMGRLINDETFTEYHHGNGEAILYLRQGPMISVTSVETIAYSDGGGGARSESATAIEAYRRLERGLASENVDGPAGIELIGETFPVGRRNVKVIYVAGYTTVPETLAGQATAACVAAFNSRSVHGLQSKTHGEVTVDPSSPEMWDRFLDRIAAPWRYDWGLA